MLQVGTISANGEKEIGDLIAKAMERVGKEGVITVEVRSIERARSPRPFYLLEEERTFNILIKSFSPQILHLWAHHRYRWCRLLHRNGFTVLNGQIPSTPPRTPLHLALLQHDLPLWKILWKRTGLYTTSLSNGYRAQWNHRLRTPCQIKPFQRMLLFCRMEKPSRMSLRLSRVWNLIEAIFLPTLSLILNWWRLSLRMLTFSSMRRRFPRKRCFIPKFPYLSKLSVLHLILACVWLTPSQRRLISTPFLWVIHFTSLLSCSSMTHNLLDSLVVACCIPYLPRTAAYIFAKDCRLCECYGIASLKIRPKLLEYQDCPSHRLQF